MSESLVFNEAERLAALYRYSILDTAPEKVYDQLTRLAARLFDVSVVLLGLVDQDRLWVKSNYGFKNYQVDCLLSFSHHTIQSSHPLIVYDMQFDVNFCHNPLVTGEPYFRFYAGAPLRTSDGFRLGTLSLFDTHPRTLSAEQQANLEDLASIVMNQLELRLSRLKLARSQELYRTLLHNYPNGAVFLYDHDLRFLVAQGKSLETTGLSPEKVEGSTLKEVLPPELAQQLAPYYQAGLAGQEATFELNDRGRIYLNHIRPVKNDEGEVIAGLVASQEITSRVRMEEDLRESQERLTRIVETIADGITIVNQQSQLTFANPAAEQLLNLTRSSLTGQPYNDPHWKITDVEGNPFPPEQLAFAQVMRSGKAVYNVEYAVEHTNGRWVILSTSAAPLHNAKGEIIGVISSLRDITEQKWAEVERIQLLKREKVARREAEAAHTRVSNILESITDAFFTVDHDWCFTYVNHNAQILFEKSKEELLGHNIWEVFPEATDLAFYTEAQKAIIENRAVHFEALYPPLNKWFEATCYPSQEGLSAYFRDVTDRKQAEMALRESEEQFRTLSSSSFEGVIIHENGQIVLANQAAADIVGYPLEEFLQHNIHEFIAPEDWPVMYEKAATKDIKPYELTGLRRDGSRFPVENQTQDIVYKGRQMRLAAFQDITERKKMEEALRLSEARLSGIINSATDAIITLNSQFRIVVFNKAAEQIFGCVADQAIGQTLDKFIPAGSHQLHQQHIENFAGTETNPSRTMSSMLRRLGARRTNGEEFPIEATFSQVEAGGQRLLTAIIRDITERQKIEEALAAEQTQRENKSKLLRAVLNLLPVGVTIMDTQGQLVERNIEDRAIWGEIGPVNQVIDHPVSEYKSWRVSTGQPLDQLDWAAARALLYGDISLDEELYIESFDGHKKTILNSAVPIRDETGAITHAVSVNVDITERKKAEEALRDSEERYRLLNLRLEQRVGERTAQLEAANKELANEISERARLEEELREALQKERELNDLKSRFVSMTSHEFRTPLSTILATAELLKRYNQRWSEEKKLELFHRIETATLHMTNMLEDILIIGKAESGKLEFKPVALDMPQFCRNMVEEIQLGQGLGYLFEFSSQGSAPVARLDEKLLRQIVGNLLSNAVKYSSPGSTIFLELNCQPEGVTLKITDQGIGIPTEDLPRLFEVFHRAKNVGSVQGTGLGLTIVKRSVDLHEGTITINSEIGIGTSFTVWLPTVEQPAK